MPYPTQQEYMIDIELNYTHLIHEGLALQYQPQRVVVEGSVLFVPTNSRG